jgi:hypothetical protein
MMNADVILFRSQTHKGAAAIVTESFSALSFSPQMTIRSLSRLSVSFTPSLETPGKIERGERPRERQRERERKR